MTSSTEILLTRPADEGAAFARDIGARWPGAFRIVEAPMTRIVRETAPVALDGIQALLFTSANGVRALAGVTARRDLPALCVGPGTAAAARAAGFAAESADGDAGALAALAAASWQPGAGAFLHVRGRQTAGDLAGALMAEGIEVAEVVLYDARPVAAPEPFARARLEAGTIRAALFFSPRAAGIFASFAEDAAAEGRGWSLRHMAVLAIAAAAAEPLAGLGFARTEIAARPEAGAMLDLLAPYAASARPR
jgi:uroporphyrinogen-III synthase